MNSPENKLRPGALFTLKEVDELDTLIRKTYALADVLNCSFFAPSDGPEPDNLSWITGELFLYAQKVCEIWKEGSERDQEARGGKAHALSTPTPGLANAKVPVAALWKHLEDLEAVADDPAKVREWAGKVHDELGKCKAV